MSEQLLQQILALEPTEQAHIVEEVWETLLHEHPEVAPVTSSQRAELNRRMQSYQDNPHPGTPAKEVHARIRAKHVE